MHQKIELIIEIDKNDTYLWLRPRTDFLSSEHIHRSSHLILFNSKKEILLQQRAQTKKVWPGVYTFSVDSTVWDESYEACIQREMKEELGISIDVQRLFTFPCFTPVDKAWKCVFVGKYDGGITPDPREIDHIQRVDPDFIKKDIIRNSHLYCPPFIDGMKIYFDLHHDTLGIL